MTTTPDEAVRKVRERLLSQPPFSDWNPNAVVVDQSDEAVRTLRRWVRVSIDSFDTPEGPMAGLGWCVFNFRVTSGQQVLSDRLDNRSVAIADGADGVLRLAQQVRAALVSHYDSAWTLTQVVHVASAAPVVDDMDEWHVRVSDLYRTHIEVPWP